MTSAVLIVGASQAGVQLAASLRDLGHSGPITVVGAETPMPYQRPPLSKEYLSGKASEDMLVLRTEQFYAERAILVLRGERVTQITRGQALTDLGRTLAFDQLALTVGARPRRLAIPGATLPGVTYLRTLADARGLRDRLATARDVVVIGGGFIGLEAAAAAREQGKNVTVVEAAPRLLGRAVAPAMSAFFYDVHSRRGVDIRLGTLVAAIEGGQTVARVRLQDGSVLPADLVVVGVGVEPRTELAEQLNLECDGGIVVDAYARTSDPSIVAAGDCTSMPHPHSPGRVRLESMPHAVYQAKIAAATLTGRLQAYAEVPWFWSDQYDLKLQMAGLADGFDQVVTRGEPGSEQFSLLYYREDRLLAVHAVNRVPDFLVARKALAAGVSLPADRAADASTPLKALLAEATAP